MESQPATGSEILFIYFAQVPVIWQKHRETLNSPVSVVNVKTVSPNNKSNCTAELVLLPKLPDLSTQDTQVKYVSLHVEVFQPCVCSHFTVCFFIPAVDHTGKLW